MVKTLGAVYQNGVLRLTEPLPLEENQEVTVTISDHRAGTLASWLDQEYLAGLDGLEESEPSLEEVRRALSGVPGNLSDDIRAERDARG